MRSALFLRFLVSLFMVDDARRNHLHVEVGNHVRTDDHGALLLVKCFDYRFYRVTVAVNVVAIELDGKFSAQGWLMPSFQQPPMPKSKRLERDERFVCLFSLTLQWSRSNRQ
jgi:hypothetical protein